MSVEPQANHLVIHDDCRIHCRGHHTRTDVPHILSLLQSDPPRRFYRCLNRIPYVFHAPRRADKDTIPLPNYHESHRVRVGKEMNQKQINIYRARRGHQPKEYSASASYLQIEIA